MPKNKPVRTFFILGLPRSGTTLLEQMMDQHSKVRVCPEMATGLALWRLNASEIVKNKWKHLLLLNYIYDRVSFFKTSMTECLAAQAIREFDFPVKTTDWFNPVIRDFVNEKSAELYGEKTPENLAYILELKKAFPGSKFILLLRHPMDVIYSIYENAEHLGNSPLSQKDILKWVRPIIKRDLNTILKYKKNILPEYKFVKYEDLILDPQVVLKEICSFLGIEFEPQMLDYQNKKEFSERGEDMQKIHTLLNEPVHAGRIHRSFHLMQFEELLFLNEYLKDELKNLGFPLAPVHIVLSLQIRISVFIAKLKYKLKLDMMDGLSRKIRFQVHAALLNYLRWLPIRNRLMRRFVFK